MSEPSQSPDRHQQDDAFASHEAALLRSQAWGALASLYAGRLEAPDLADRPDECARLLEKRGMLLERYLGDPAAAVADYQQAARLAPDEPGPLQRLRKLYAERGDHAMVLQLAEAELPRLRDGGERARLLETTADIWERVLGDADQARELRARAEEERAQPRVPAPTNSTTTTATATPGVEAGVEEAGSATERAWLAAARGDSDAAVALLREALAQEPGDVEAIDMLITVLEGADRHAETTEWLERRAELGDETTRAAVLSRLATVREALGDRSGACAALEQALEAQPEASQARSTLMRLYRETEAWTRLQQLLEASSRRGSEAERIEALIDLAELFEQRFDDPDGAARSLRAALALRGDEPRALDGLARLGRPAEPAELDAAEPDDAQRAERILGVLERKLARLLEEGRGSALDSVELRLRMAELRAESLDDVQTAIGLLEPLLDSEEGAEAVAGGLANLYERAGRFESLAELARRMASHDAPERAHWLRRAAETAQSAGRSDLAIACFEHLLEDTPDDATAERALLDLYRSRGETEPLVDLLRRSLTRAEGAREREIHVELASQLEGPLADATTALVHLTRAIELDPSDPAMLSRGLAIAGLVGGDLGQLDLLDQATAMSPEPSLRARLLARRASLMADQMGWMEEAAEGWRLAQQLDPACAEACDRLGIQARA